MADEVTTSVGAKMLFQAGLICMGLSLTVLLGAIPMLMISMVMVVVGLWFGGREMVMPLILKMNPPHKEDKILEKKKKAPKPQEAPKEEEVVPPDETF